MDISQTLSIIPPKIKFVFRNLKRTKKNEKTSCAMEINFNPWECLWLEMLQERSSWCPTDAGAALELPWLVAIPAGWLVGWLSHWPALLHLSESSFTLFSLFLSDSRSEAAVIKTKNKNHALPWRLPLTVRDSRGISGARLGDGELKIKVSVVEAATTRFQVTQLLFKWDTVIRRRGGGGASLVLCRLRVLRSFNLSHIQSLRWCVHRKTWNTPSQRECSISKQVRQDSARTLFAFSPKRLGSARTIFCFFFFFPEVTVSKRCCCCCWLPEWFDW